MKRFRRILVGIDLSWGDCFVGDELSEPNAEAVRQALWLAKLNSASIDFLFSLDLSAKAQQLVSESSTTEYTVLTEAEGRIAELAAKAREEGVVSGSHVVVGKSWLELIRQVLRQQHDLVVVGTRHRGAIRGFLLGSTGIKLLRKCPCAVLVTQPRERQQFNSILVAHDLRPVGDLAMEFGCSMAKLQNAQLHVVHAAELPEFDYMFPARISAERKQAYLREAEEHIESQLASADLSLPAKVHFVINPKPDFAIMNCVKQHHIDLIVMGTVGRAGISGFITGSTAAVNVFVFGELFYLFNCRSLRYSMFRLGVFSNPWVLFGAIAMAGLQMLFTYAPPMNYAFGSEPIGFMEWSLVVGIGMLIYLVVGTEKWLRRRFADARVTRLK